MKLLIIALLAACFPAGCTQLIAKGRNTGGPSAPAIALHHAWISPARGAKTTRLNLYFSNRGARPLHAIILGIRPPGRPTRKFRHAGPLAPGRSVFLSREIAGGMAHRGTLRLLSMEYRRGRESFIIRDRRTLRRGLPNRAGIIAGEKKFPVIQSIHARRMNFERAAAACEFQAGRLPSLREARSIFAREGDRTRRVAARTIWTATAFHHSRRAAWVFHPKGKFARGALRNRRAGVICIAAGSAHTNPGR